jgi:hypothetical protein
LREAASQDAPFLQAKLKVGPPDDEYEREADRVAEKVMRMPAPGLFHHHEEIGPTVALHASTTGSEKLQRKPGSRDAMISGCANPNGVLSELKVAAADASFAVSHLEWLASLPREERAREWNNGLERTWFGGYSGHRFRVIKWRLRRILDQLRQPKPIRPLTRSSFEGSG